MNECGTYKGEEGQFLFEEWEGGVAWGAGIVI